MFYRTEGQHSELVVIGEKGKAQLQRDQASHIKESIADVSKVRITFSQVRATLELVLLLIPQRQTSAADDFAECNCDSSTYLCSVCLNN